MVSSQFEAILKILEEFFNCPLNPDHNDSCLIKMGIGLSIQIELDSEGFLLIGCRLGFLPTGRYRTALIQQILKFNDQALPSTGVFGLSPKSHQLILFMRIHPSQLTKNLIDTALVAFIQQAKRWKDAMDKGDIPPLETSSSTARSSGGMFNLI
jgi:Tir chaperone protein (CesT) family